MDNIEEQKNDAELGEQVNRSSRRKKLGANGRHDHAEEEVTPARQSDWFYTRGYPVLN